MDVATKRILEGMQPAQRTCKARCIHSKLSSMCHFSSVRLLCFRQFESSSSSEFEKCLSVPGSIIKKSAAVGQTPLAASRSNDLQQQTHGGSHTAIGPTCVPIKKYSIKSSDFVITVALLKHFTVRRNKCNYCRRVCCRLVPNDFI
jgi:hypothetical protein